jgi:hypothetical protein
MLTQKNTNPDAPDETDAYRPTAELESIVDQIDEQQKIKRAYLAGKLTTIKRDKTSWDSQIMNPITKEVYTSKERATEAQSTYVDTKGVVHNIIQDKDRQKDLKQAKLSIAGPSGDPDAIGTVAKAKGKAIPISVTKQKIMDREGISRENLDAVKKMTASGDGRKLEGNIASAKLIQRIARGRVARQRKDDAISAIAKDAYLRLKPDELNKMNEIQKEQYNALPPEAKKDFDKDGIRQTRKDMIVELKEGARQEAPLYNQYIKTLAKQEKDLKDVATTGTHWDIKQWNNNKSGLSKVIKNMTHDENNTEAVLGNLMKTLDWIKLQDETEAQKTGKRSSTKFNLFRLAVQKHMINNGFPPDKVKEAVKVLNNVDIMKRYFMAQKPKQDKSAPSTPRRRRSIMPRANFETPNQPPLNDQNPNFSFGDFP